MSWQLRLARAVLRRTLPEGITRESVIGDLDQELRELGACHPDRRLGGWYLWEATKIGLRFRMGRWRSPGWGGRVRGGFKRMGPLERMEHDVRRGFRRVAKTPGLAVFAALAIGLGIGATTTTFSLTRTAFQDLPYPEAGRLIALSWNRPSRGLVGQGSTAPEFTEWRLRQGTLEGLAAYVTGPLNLSDQESFPERVEAAKVTANAFRLLRAHPALGRGFLDEEEQPGRTGVAVLSHELWVRRYGQDPGILGRTVRIDGTERTVVGVMPPRFQFPRKELVWIPLELDPVQGEEAGVRNLAAFGRLGEGRTLEEAEAEFAALAHRFAAEEPGRYEGLVFRFSTYEDYLIGSDALVILLSLLLVVSSVLLVACASVTNLLLARAAHQTRETAVQLALGASRGRIMTQVLAEALLISSMGGALGVGIAYLGAGLLQRTMGSVLTYFWMSIQVDPSVLVFAFALVFLSSVLTGAVPALRASKVPVNDTLKDQTYGATGLRLGRWSRRLVVAQVAFSCSLLSVAGLTAKDLASLLRVDHGFEADAVLTARLSLAAEEYGQGSDRIRLQRELLQRLEGQPGIRFAALTTSLPGRAANLTRFLAEGEVAERDQDLPRARYRVITQDFFRILDVEPLEGRVFSPSDGVETLPLVLVNQSFAERFFPGESPLGRRIRPGNADSQGPWLTIVGVVPDLGMNGPERTVPEGMYLLLDQRPPLHTNILLRAQGAPLPLVPLVRSAVVHVDPDLPVFDVGTVAGELRKDLAPYAAIVALLMLSGLVALLLAGVGLFGILAFSVSTRSREMGIRVALGAGSYAVLWMVLRSGLKQIGAGILTGALLALGLSLALQELFQVTSPLDLTVYGGVAAILAATGLAASLLPAIRAVGTDPARVLRTD